MPTQMSLHIKATTSEGTMVGAAAVDVAVVQADVAEWQQLPLMACCGGNVEAMGACADAWVHAALYLQHQTLTS